MTGFGPEAAVPAGSCATETAFVAAANAPLAAPPMIATPIPKMSIRFMIHPLGVAERPTVASE